MEREHSTRSPECDTSCTEVVDLVNECVAEGDPLPNPVEEHRLSSLFERESPRYIDTQRLLHPAAEPKLSSLSERESPRYIDTLSDFQTGSDLVSTESEGECTDGMMDRKPRMTEVVSDDHVSSDKQVHADIYITFSSDLSTHDVKEHRDSGDYMVGGNDNIVIPICYRNDVVLS